MTNNDDSPTSKTPQKQTPLTNLETRYNEVCKQLGGSIIELTLIGIKLQEAAATLIQQPQPQQEQETRETFQDDQQKIR